MRHKNNKNNIKYFLFYLISTISATAFLLIFLTLKNECQQCRHEITQLNRKKVYNTNIVKELQSQKQYLMSEHHITNVLSTKMIAVAPETLSVYIKLDQ